MRFLNYCFFLLLFTSVCFAQKTNYSVALIADSLKVNANAVVRLDQTDIDLRSQRELVVKHKKVVTVFNEKGQNAIDANAYYSKTTHVRSIEATIYDTAGTELKHIRRKDFKDQSTFDGISIANDDRVIFLDYIPIQYPFTIVYECEISSSNTAFIPQWYPLSDYFVSVEKSNLNVTFAPNLGFTAKEFNFSGLKIAKTGEASGSCSYTAIGLVAQKPEYLSPDSSEIFPKIMMSVEFFNLEGIDGNAKTWNEFGKWYSEKILSGTTELSEETKAKIIALVGSEQNPIAKARIVYNYVQQKSRYVSIQLGIGGFKPMLAKDVDRLAYGDCKALSNYTKALLEVVGVPSYNTILYGDSYRKSDIQSDVVSVQGNHMMLAIPDGNKYIWLECTSHDIPFGYQANATDDRNVLVVKPDGGEIVRTKDYPAEGNLQRNQGSYKLDADGGLSGKVTIVSEGAQYVHKYHLKDESPTKKEAYYKDFWDNISNLKIENSSFTNDYLKASFAENLTIAAANYGVISGDKMLFAVNAYNVMSDNVKRIRNRKTPFQILRGFLDQDEITIELPVGFVVESMPANFALDTKFGKYKTELIRTDDAHVIFKRNLVLNKGLYANTEYEAYRNFMEQIARNDNAKIVLTKKI